MTKEIINGINGKCLFAFSGITVILYLLRDLSGIGIPESVFVLLYFMGITVLPIEGAFCYFALSIPLTLSGNPIRLIYVVLMIIKLFKRQTTNIDPVAIICPAIIIGIELINIMVWTSNESFGWLLYSVIEKASFIVIPVLWFMVALDIDTIKKAIYNFVLGALTVSVSIISITIKHKGLTGLLNPTSFERLGMGSSEYYETGSSIVTSLNTNDLAIMAVVCVALLFLMINKRLINFTVGLLGCVYFVIVILLTKSRTGLITLVLFILIYTCYILLKEKKIFKTLVFIILVIITCITIVNFLPNVLDGIVSRFLNQSDITNGRNEINLTYFEEWISNLWCFIFGYGINTYPEVSNMSISAHNAFVDVFMSVGFIGLISTVIFDYRLAKACIKKQHIGKMDLLLVMPIVILFIASMGGQYYTVANTHLRFCFIIVICTSLCQINARNEKIEKAALEGVVLNEFK